MNANILKINQEVKDNWIQIQCKSIDHDMGCERHYNRAYETQNILTKSSRRNTSVTF